MVSKRVGLPAAAALLLAVSPWITWWTMSSRASEVAFDLDARMSLYDSTVCGAGQCMSIADAPGAWRAFGFVVMACVLAAAIAAGTIAVRALSDRDPGLAERALRVTCRATFVAIAVSMAYAMLRLDGTPSWGPLVAGAGAVLGLFAAAEAVIDAPNAHVGAAAVGAPTGAARASGPLRFVCASGSIEEIGLRADDRLLAWRDVARVIVRRLPPDPPWEKASLLDLVPKSGAPVRLTSTSKLDFASLPGGAAPTMKENWRRLIALAREANPAIEIDRESAPFFSGAEAPMFPGWRKFLEYDARYAIT